MKQNRYENYRFVSEPCPSRMTEPCYDENTHNQQAHKMGAMARQLTALCDAAGIPVQAFRADWDRVKFCSHCKSAWEIDEETGEPVCCDKAIDEFRVAAGTKETKP